MEDFWAGLAFGRVCGLGGLFEDLNGVRLVRGRSPGDKKYAKHNQILAKVEAATGGDQFFFALQILKTKFLSRIFPFIV